MAAPIVVGTDGSGPAGDAVDWAADEAALRHRPLHIVHAAEIWPYQVRRFTAEPGPVSRAGRALLAETEERVRERRPKVRVTTSLAVNSTVTALREESAKAFELVLGHRGHGGFAGLPLGSVCLRLAGRSAVPLVIVRGGDGVHGEVAVGHDLDAEPDGALRYAFDAAAVRGARLRVVYAWQISAALAQSGYSVDEERVNDEQRARVIETYAPLRERYPMVDVVDEVLRGHPVAALTQVSRTADLLVVGAHDRPRGMPRLGSVSHGAIHHAECPVAVVSPS